MRRQHSQLFQWLALLLPVYSLAAQGAFQNLNFESANISGYSPGANDVPIAAGLPGWSAGINGTDSTSTIVYDGISLGGAFISIIDANVGFGFKPIEGNFSVYLFSQGLTSPISTSISQTGFVPDGTRSLKAKMLVQGPAPVLMIGGQIINMVPLASLPTYTLYGGDVASFAGQVTTLSFTEPPPTHSSPSSLLLDSIVFSTQQIPEPSVLGLSAFSVLIASWHRRRASQSTP